MSKGREKGLAQIAGTFWEERAKFGRPPVRENISERKISQEIEEPYWQLNTAASGVVVLAVSSWKEW